MPLKTVKVNTIDGSTTYIRNVRAYNVTDGMLNMYQESTKDFPDTHVAYVLRHVASYETWEG